MRLPLDLNRTLLLTQPCSARGCTVSSVEVQILFAGERDTAQFTEWTKALEPLLSEPRRCPAHYVKEKS